MHSEEGLQFERKCSMERTILLKKLSDWPMTIITIHKSIILNKGSQTLNSGHKIYFMCTNSTNLQLFIPPISCEQMWINLPVRFCSKVTLGHAFLIFYYFQCLSFHHSLHLRLRIMTRQKWTWLRHEQKSFKKVLRV
jgi:hypothetical protein